MGRARIVGGVVGPAALIATWATLGARTHGYSPVADPISRLAASGAPTQAAMTAGLLAYAAGVGSYSRALPPRFGSRAALAAAWSAIGSVGIAATPLDSRLGGSPHAIAAGLTYASLAATPLLAAGALSAGGRRATATLSVGVGAVSGVCLALSAWGPTELTGLFQRIGLTTGHTWLMATAIWQLTDR